MNHSIDSLGERAWLPQLIAVDKVAAFPHHGQDLVELTCYRLLLVRQGKAQFLVGGQPVVVRSPGLYLLKPGMKLESQRPPQKPIEAYVTDFHLYSSSRPPADTAMDGLYYERSDELAVCGPIGWRTDALKRLVLQLYASRDEQMNTSHKLVQCQRMLKLLELLLTEEQPREEAPTDERMLEAIMYATDHCHEEVTIEQLSERAGMRLSSFSRRFRQLYDKSPVAYMTQMRTNRAKELLIKGNWTNMREVAQSCGFHDEFYFSRRFKKQHGVAPTHYRLEVTEATSIVSLSYPYTEQLLSLGLVPRAAQVTASLQDSLPMLPLPYHEKDSWEISRNVFVDCAPELIVCKDNVVRQARRHLGDLAPVLSFSWRSCDVYGLQEQLAHALGRHRELAQWRERYALQEQEARAALPEEQIGATLAICVLHARGWRLYGARNIGHVFYRSLGFQPPEQVRSAMADYAPGTEFTWLELDPERLDEVEADYIAFVTASEQGEAETRRRLQETVAWRRHPAVRDERYALLDWHRWMVYAPLSLEWQLEQAVTLFGGHAAK
ncbi:hypothetical protein PA598K_00126 [Paenibacillus sp. 598K]|uniref:helix-turn-helix domain-containing protein n=1 Tax=Paenibacillus sp. 598K TaxID=1117987 RepID=UPI000FFA6531|nr:helix-turn-helix domain-containing protein [Paenibacillus sp. 598K]GBF71913.1 hypothetical protein PA598K_00126 [Paenibacillus sp. 598K]